MRTKMLLLAAVLAVCVPMASAASVTAIDADHDLADRESIEEYDRTGVASTAVTAVDMRITVAEEHDDVGLRGFRLDATNRYLRFQYNESIEREVRVFIPSEYWHPTVSLGHEAENSTLEADMRPTDGGRYTSVTVDFDGQTDAVFAVSAVNSGWFAIKDSGRDVIQNSTGYEPPRIGSGGEWRYLPSGQLANESSYPINESGDITIQYDSTPDAEEQTWLSVQDCSSDDAPVCTFEKRGVDGTFVLSKTSEPPEVRWKPGTDPRASASSALNDIASIPDRIQDALDALFGG